MICQQSSESALIVSFSNATRRENRRRIHVQRERFLAKFWLNPVALAGSKIFASHELRTIQKHVEDNRKIFLEAWNEYITS